MKHIRWFHALGAAAIMSMAGLGSASQSVDATLIEQQLASQILVTRTTADRSEIVKAGSVVELHKEGLLMYGVASPLPPSNTYKNGKISQGWGGFGKDLLITMLAPGNGTSASYPSRKFVAGEACWVTGISVQKDSVVLQLYSDPYDGIRYYGNLKIPFPGRKVVPSGEVVLQMVAAVLEPRLPEPSGSEQAPAAVTSEDESVPANDDAGEEKPLSADDILKAMGAPAEPVPPPGEPDAHPSKAFTNKDVIALVKAGLGSEAIVAKIKQASNVTFDVSTEALISLRQKKVSSAVIASMIERENLKASQAAPKVAVSTPVDAPSRSVSPAGAIPAADTSVSRAEAPSQTPRLERVVPFQTQTATHLGIVEQLVTIDSVEVSDWPRPEKILKAENRPSDTTNVTVKFTYANRNRNNWKCQYTVAILDDKGNEIGAGVREASLGRNERADTNRVFVKMRTLDFPAASQLRVRVETWPN